MNLGVKIYPEIPPHRFRPNSFGDTFWNAFQYFSKDTLCVFTAFFFVLLFKFRSCSQTSIDIFQNCSNSFRSWKSSRTPDVRQIARSLSQRFCRIPSIGIALARLSPTVPPAFSPSSFHGFFPGISARVSSRILRRCCHGNCFRVSPKTTLELFL